MHKHGMTHDTDTDTREFGRSTQTAALAVRALTKLRMPHSAFALYRATEKPNSTACNYSVSAFQSVAVPAVSDLLSSAPSSACTILTVVSYSLSAP